MSVLLACLGALVGLVIVGGAIWWSIAAEGRRKGKSWLAPPSGRWDHSSDASSGYGDSHHGGFGGDGHAG